MEENLEVALGRLFDTRKSVGVADAKTAGSEKVPSASNLPKEAMRAFEKAVEMQRQGNWAGYGEEIRRLEQILKKMSN